MLTPHPANSSPANPPTAHIALRVAFAGDADALLAMDHIAKQDPKRHAFITRAIATGHCHIASADHRHAAFGVLEYSFFEHGFIPLLYVQEEKRRHGIGAKLLHHIEHQCTTAKLFTTANQSNDPMLRLLKKGGFTPSGEIHNLDHGAAELVFFKKLR